MTTNQTIDGVPGLRDLLEQAVAREKVRPVLESRNNTCVGCGNWMPYGHPGAHEHEDGCEEEEAAIRRHWVSQLCALLNAPAALAEIDLTPKRLAHAESVIEQQNNLIASLRSELVESYRVTAQPRPAPAHAPLDYGSLDAVKRLALCRGDVVPVSGSTCNEIREEAGQPINRPCKACGGGACIDR